MGETAEELGETAGGDGGRRLLETTFCVFHMLTERSQTRGPHVA